jgi:CHAT domain-containing protein
MRTIRYMVLLAGLMGYSLGFAYSLGCSENGEGGKAFQRGDFLAAARHWQNAHQRFSKNSPDGIDTAVCLAEAYLRLGRIKAAFPILENAQSAAEKIDDQVRRAKVLMGFSDVYVAVRDYQYNKTDCGMRKVREAIAPSFREQKILKKEDILQKASDTLEEAEKLLVCKNQVSHSNPSLCANLLNRQGQVLLLQVHLFKQKIQILKRKEAELERKLQEIKRQKEQGLSQKNHQRDIIEIKRALFKKKLDKEQKETATLKKYQQVLSTYDNSQRFARQANDLVLSVVASVDYIQALQFGFKNGIGESDAQKKAKQEIVKVLLLLREKNLPESHDKASGLMNIAQLMRDLWEVSKEQKEWRSYLLTEAFRSAKENKDIFSMAQAKGYLAEVEAEQKDYDEAVKLTRSAIFHAQRYPNFHNYPELLARLQWQLGAYFEKLGKPEKAIQAYRTASDFFQKVRRYYGSSSPLVSDMEEQLYLEWVNLLLKKASIASKKEKTELLKQAIDALELLKGAELRNYFQDDCITEKKTLKVEDLLSSHPNVAVFYPIVLKDRVELLLISNQQIKKIGGFRLNEVFGKKQIHTAEEFKKTCSADNLTSLSITENFHQTVECFRYHLEEDESQQGQKPVFLKLAQTLYQWLINPIALELDKRPQKIDTLIIVPSDILYTIPFAALHDGKNFLVEKDYALVITPSLKLTDPTPLSRDFRRVLLGGTGKFEDNKIAKLCYVPVELKRISSVLAGEMNLEENDEFRIEVVETWKEKFACLSPADSEYRKECLPKEFSCPQYDNKDNLLIDKDTDILFDQEFTLFKLKEQFRKVPYSIVHLATHAQFEPEPNETYLKTYEADKKDFLGRIILSDLEEFVHLAKFRTQPLELLTLSACETALGNKHAAFGLSGVALKAGARSAIGTLWEVKDPSTAYVMIEFYRLLKKDTNLSVARALQQAQKRLFELGKAAKEGNAKEEYRKYQHPHYWAPFLLIGNWK